MEATQGALRAGDRLDRYELLCPIASGGMATVWLARLRGKRGFEKLFAIKTIRTELVDDPLFQEMLLDEARIASNIQHPNVAQILDLGEANDVLFIVMERVDGDSLAKIRKLLSRLGASIPLGIGLRVLADACAGLHAAHELRDEHGRPLGIVHRDVSPQNILVSVAGAVKVIDFGIAKAQNRQQGETRTGVFKGKVQYMAPEQVKKGAIVDRRADIWALGVCLHEIVTGKVPNDGDDHVEVIRRVLSDEPPAIAEGLPEPVARILSKSLNLDPDARFPTAAAMQDAFEEAMNELEVATTGSDIAAFLRSELPELEEKRRTIVLQSVDEARGRDHTPVSTTGDEAFAPTVMRERLAGARSAETIADERPDDADEEPIRIPKQSRAWLWSLLLLTAVGVGVRLARPAWVTQALDRFAPAWALPWLAGQEPSGPSAGRVTEPPRAVLPPPASSLEPTESASASARGATPPKPSPSRPAPRTPVVAASDTWIDAAATSASRLQAEGGLQGATPEATHGATQPSATAMAPAASATSEAPPSEPAPSAVAPTPTDSPDAGESSPY
jgi:eukaryotic-like serine/threonine-protein kinase